jgi:hypothetical protein
LNSYTLSIAGFKIFLESENKNDFRIDEAYIPFKAEYESGKDDFKVLVCKGFPADSSIFNTLVFEGKDNVRKYFSVFMENDYYIHKIYDPSEPDRIQQIAFLKKDLSEWTIHVNEDNAGLLHPLSYPMGPIVLYYLTARYQAIMLHASGVYDGLHGRLFTGFSGNGKSTMAGIWQHKGCQIVNDDRLMLRREEDGFFMYNTPMFYPDLPKRAPLKSLYIIEHAETNRIEELCGAYAVSQVMAFCIQHAYQKKFLEHHLKFISELCEALPVYKIGFVPDENVVEFIRNHGT